MIFSDPNKARLLLDGSHSYINSAIVITNWLMIAKYLFLLWQWSFSLIRRCAQPPYYWQDFHQTYLWVTWRVSCKKQKLITLVEHLSSSCSLDGVRVVFCVTRFHYSSVGKKVALAGTYKHCYRYIAVKWGLRVALPCNKAPTRCSWETVCLSRFKL